ncbi:hypothetical protein [Arenicella xantha]|uniref:Uncharacterized protein n=1 Tax=Arenicella xantha TaxID=644221 RepID=A0A395JN68_9GAMM|nr:hypothetical protein [Arenicella xantha]RBP53100.1 hypothetical protein DFR28_101485 [Arenicella xantha]
MDSATAVGGNQLIFTNVSTARSPLFYLQGTELGDDVVVTIEVFETGTETPIGYESLSSTVDVDPSGVYLGTGDFTMTTFGANRAVQVRSAVLRDTEDSVHLEGQFLRDQAVRGGQNLTVPMLVADSNVIALPAGASGDLSIVGGQLSGIIEADPLTAGVTTISIANQPNASFSLPNNRSGEITATVRAPSVALISKDPLPQGSASLTFDKVTSASVGTIYVQGLSVNGATQLRVSAPGYSDGTADVAVVPSGFQLTGSFSNMSVGDSRNLSVRSGRLFNNGAFSGVQAVRGGQSFAIDVTSSDASVGAITSPVMISNGESSGTAKFSAVAPGTTTIQVLQPVGFSPPVGTSDADITVQ